MDILLIHLQTNNMKRLSIIVSLLFACVFGSLGQIQHQLTFNEADYYFNTNNEGYTTILGQQEFSYEENNNPCLPILVRTFALPYGSFLENYSFEISNPRLIKENVILTSNPTMLPIVETLEDNIDLPIRYEDGVFPTSNLTYVNTTQWQGVSMANFLISPFIYDTIERKLYFIDTINIVINISTTDNNSITTEDTDVIRKVVKNLSTNKEDVDDIISQIPEQSYYYRDEIEYLIITNSELEPSFHKLLNWKRTKGLYSGIITLEEIQFRYDGDDMQEKIKKCIFDAYLNYGLKYVVLGGDDTIVPVRGCYSTASIYTDYEIPSDKYYGCFGGNFQWDGNGNGIFGELTDNIDFSENVYISRIPTRDIDQTDNYIKKLIDYETGHKSSNWSKSMLTGGVKKWNTDSVRGSDTYCQGNIFYERFISPNWDGQRFSFYDTYTDFAGGANYDVTWENVQEQLSAEYMFFSFGTHGAINTWQMEKEPSYSAYNAKELTSPSVPIITTEACSTNAFDNIYDPCLSESFLRSPLNDVVAYWGSSRYGWGQKSYDSLGASLDYEGYFYRNLFGKEVENKNLGRIISMARMNYIPFTNYYSSIRWLQFSLNIVGDSEMPVYTDLPKTFHQIDIQYNPEARCIDINTNVPDTRISVIGCDYNGVNYHDIIKKSSIGSFYRLPKDFVVSVTKQNYKPYIYMVKQTENGYLQGEADYEIYGPKFIDYDYDIQNDQNDSFNSLLTYDVDKSNKEIRIKSCQSIPSSSVILLRNAFGYAVSYPLRNGEVSINAENLISGVYVISLVTGGEIIDSKKIVL